ncbi:MAG: hypothetical protein MUF03_08160 [Rubrivivax sp.]|nr:hypothetical protein [Rubrivivax sp.]
MTPAAIGGWALALAAVVAGWVGWGWRGVALALTVVVFWLLLQFSRALRVMRIAAQRPVGDVASAVMLASRLHRGMRLAQVILLTHSLGRALSPPPDERFEWRDAAGDRVELLLRDGRLVEWQLERAPAAPTDRDDGSAAF